MNTKTTVWMLAVSLFLSTAAGVSAATGCGTATANVDSRDYSLTVESAHGIPAPAAGTHSGYCWRSSVNCSVVNSGYSPYFSWTCTGWSGSGSVPLAGTALSTGEFVLTEVASTIAWQWEEHVIPFYITTVSPLPWGLIGYEYRQTLTVTGGAAPYNWSVADGSLPAGLTLSADGVLSGLPTAAGTTNFTVSVSDGGGYVATRPLILTVADNFLPAALDCPGWVWTLGGSAPWFSQTDTAHDGADAAQSGPITHNQESWIQSTVEGPGRLTYWWKVSSEDAFDYLEFVLDGNVENGGISGETDWQKMTNRIAAGTHTVRWRYAKDGSDNGGQDAGWVDEVTFIPDSWLPGIATQPVSRTNAAGTVAAFSVSATGQSPLSYQWRRFGTNLVNGARVSGATNSTLTLSSVQMTEAGSYSVEVWNPYGSVTSQVAVLSVTNPPTISMPEGCVAWWRAEGDFLDSVYTNHGSNSNGVAFAGGGVGQCFSFNGSSFLTVSNAPALQLPNAPFSITTWFKTVSTNSQILLSKGVSDANEEYTINLMGDGSIYWDYGGSTAYVLTSPKVFTTNRWCHLAVLYTPSPVPSGQVYVDGILQANLFVGALAHIVSTASPLYIGTQKAGTPYYSGRTSFRGLIDEVAIFNRALSTNEITALYLNGSVTVGQSPQIATHPQSTTNLAGTAATFSVVATGTVPLAYQWSFNGTNIVGATSASLTLPNVQPAQAGFYRVTISNAYGSVTSTVANLTVWVPPAIMQQPQSQTNITEAAVTFTVGAGGTPPFAYQWKFNGTNLVGATNSSLTLASLQTANAGLYTVTITNVYGSATSQAASLTVLASDYLIVDVSGGSTATNYPVRYLTAVPPGGWTDAYKTTNMVFRRIPAGTFLMGSPADEFGRQTNETLHQVTLTQDTYIGVFEVSQKQWERVMGNWPSWFYNASYRDSRPVEQVSYNDIRGASTGSNWPASNNVDPTSFMGKLRARTSQAFDLPTESQWEYACRAGTATALNSGHNITNLNSDAHVQEVARYWYTGGSGYTANGTTNVGTTIVGSLLPNSWGLYDLHGNVWEWCLDWYGAYSGTANDPKGLSSGTYRAARSASWGDYAYGMRSGYRNDHLYPNYGDRSLGFRVALPPTPPAITQQPISVTNYVGANVTFGVTVSGSTPLSCQWQRNGTNVVNGGSLSGATSNLLSLANIQTSDAGSYTVVVSNPYGSVTSVVASLTVWVRPAITAQPQSVTNLAGTAATFGVTATGTAPLAYQWRFNATNLVGATFASLTLTNVQPANAGSYAVIVTSVAGSVTSAVANLTVWVPAAIIAQPQSRTNLRGTTATFGVTAIGTAPLAYQWLFNGANIAGATASSLTLTNVQPSHAGNYSVVVTNVAGSVTSEAASLTVWVPVSITQQPQGATNLTGTTAQFGVTATGTAPLAYQWRLNGTNIVGATDTSLTLANVQTNHAGNYTVVIGNVAGSVTSAVARLTVWMPPVITLQPQSQTNLTDATVIFNVGAVGTAPLAYQWQFNGTNLAGATGASLTLATLKLSHAGLYTVVVTNVAGRATSAAASLTVLPSDYLVVDVSGGPTATNYPMNYLATAPTNGWTDAYKTTNIVFRRIPAGTFTMGSPADELGRQTNELLHQVTLTQDTYIGVFEVSQKQWERVMGSWPSYFTNLTYRDSRPVERVSYNDIRGTGVGTNWPANTGVDVTSFMGKLRARTGQSFDLPTEAQWEYLCRAGTATALNSGYNLTSASSDARMAEVGRYHYNGGSTYTQSGNTSVGSAKAGSYLPNAWGLYDMHGNVWEWCLDWFGTYPGTVTDPKGESSGSDRVFRGGGWYGCAASVCRSAIRYIGTPDYVHYAIGFRVALPPTPPAINQQPQSVINYVGSNVTFGVTAIGPTTLTYQWLRNGTNVVNGGSLSGATNSVLSLANIQTADADGYSVVISNPYGSVTSTVASLTVWVRPAITAQPQSVTNVAGTTATFGVAATGTAPLAYQWRLNGTNLVGATDANLTLTNVQPANAGGYAAVVTSVAGSVTSAVASLTVWVPAAITAQPQSRANVLGTAASFSVTAAGTAPLAYQWLFNGANIAGATGSSLTLNNVQPSQAGNYSVVVTNVAGSVTSELASLTVWVPVSITQQPQGATNITGTTAQFGVLATGTEPLTYQWRFNGTNIVGETGAGLTLSNVQTNHEGNYTVVIANMAGSVTSAVARLTVWMPPVITLQPQSQTNVTDATVIFTVAAVGTAPLAYQWQFNGTNLAGATGAGLTLANVQTANAGLYSVVVTNMAGSATSAAALLTVQVSDYLVVDVSGGSTATNYPVRYLATAPTNGWSDAFKTTNIVFRRIPAGTFLMGSPTNELGRQTNETLHQVTLTQDTYIGVFEVTQKQWERVMGNWPSFFTNLTYRDSRPVERVSYNDIRGAGVGTNWPANSGVDAASFMGKLRARAGLAFDLPTESQWEYACRAGTATALNSGYNLTSTTNDARMAAVGRYWYNGGSAYTQSGNASVGTAKAGSYLSNAWGLYDMHGNVWEWCLDWYGTYPDTISDPVGAALGSGRVDRGEGWCNYASQGRSAYRDYCYPNDRGYYIGFRIALLPTPPAITQQPQSVTNYAGFNAAFSVSAVGPASLSYQWQRNGTNLFDGGSVSGATSNALTLASYVSDDAGSYAVIVSNPYGSVTSAVATLTVCVAPVFTTDSPLATATVGVVYSQFLTVTGGVPPYAWSLVSGGLPPGLSLSDGLIAGTPTFTTNAAFTVRVAGTDGGASDASFALAVNPAPFTFSVSGNACTITGYTGGDSAVAVPAIIEGLPVVAIGDMAFCYDHLVEGVTLPNSVTNIGVAAFFDCVNLRSVTLGNGVVAIGDFAFQGCVSLTSLSLGSSLAMIGDSAFGYCGSLTQLTLPASLTALGNWAFYGCSGLTGVYFQGNVPAAGASVFLGATRATVYRLDGTSGWGSTFAGRPTAVWQVPPSILMQPQGSTNLTDSAVTLGVTATGTWPLAYQWQLNGTNIAGATDASLTLASVQAADAGNYTVVITNVNGSVTSAAAALTVRVSDYLVVDVFGGSTATYYPVKYLSSAPTNGWTDSYKTTRIVFRRIPAGTFMMGSPTNELGRQTNETLHQVTLSQDLYVGVFEVTQKQWERVMGTWPSYFTNVTYRDSRPVEKVSYNDIRGTAVGTSWPANNSVDATSFMGKLRARTGKTFDLPSEAQWEYVCRAGTLTALNSGYNITNVNSDARMDAVGRYWYNGGSGYTQNGSTNVGTAKAGSYLQNEWGLYDMHGNVYEWCLDWYGTYPGTATEPKGALSGSLRIGRGGSFSSTANPSRSSARGNGAPIYVSETVGFRLALPPTPPVLAQQPQSVTNYVGSNVTFRVTAEGPAPLSYQWRFNGTNVVDGGRVSGTTDTVLTLRDLQLADAGSYTVVITNPYGSVTSGVAALTVNVGQPLMVVEANGVTIADGDATPSVSDNTDFGSAAVSVGAVARTFTIRNTGIADLNLTNSPRVTVAGACVAEFTVTAQPETPVAVGAAVTFTVTFTPAAAGSRTATLLIASNDGSKNPYDFALQGMGRNNCTASFDAQGGTAPLPTSKTVSFGLAYGPLSVTSRAGYAFEGWWTGSSGTGAEVTADTLVSTDVNHTLYAKWRSVPVWVSTPVTTIGIDQLYLYVLRATSANNAPITYRALTLPAWLTLAGQSVGTSAVSAQGVVVPDAPLASETALEEGVLAAAPSGAATLSLSPVPMHNDERVAESQTFDGEGNVQPTVNSQTPFDPALALAGPVLTPPGAGPTVAESRGLLSLDPQPTTLSGSVSRIAVNPLATLFPNLTLFVTVLDAGGYAVTGLTQNAFSVSEQSSGETQATEEAITGFQEATASAGISFSLVFDVSGSMAGTPLANAKAAAVNFLTNSVGADRGNLVQFSSYSNVRVALPSDWVSSDSDQDGANNLTESIAGLVSSGMTALYDGTAKGIESLSQEPTPKAAIVFTDGQANDDVTYNINTVIAKARNEGVPIYTIGLGSSVSTAVLTQMATNTGGRYYYAPTASDMTAIYAAIARDVRSTYQVTYRTHNPSYDGTLRTVTVAAAGTNGVGTYRVNYTPSVELSAATLALSASSQTPGVALTISGTVVDRDAQSQGQTLVGTLYYGATAGGSFSQTSLALTPVSNGVYACTAQIPASGATFPGLFYYLRVSDGIQETYLPFNYSAGPFSIAILQNHAPVISHTPVRYAALGLPVSIAAVVTDTDSGDSVGQVTLYGRAHNPQQTMPYYVWSMQRGSGNTYTAQIPANLVTLAGVDYYLAAADSHGTRTECGSSTTPFFLEAGGCWLTGTPTAADSGAHTVVLGASDGVSETLQSFVIVVPAGPPTITTASLLPTGAVGVAYSRTLVATGGATPYTWSVVSGSLPVGLNLSLDGVITGVPSAVGTASFTVRVTGGNGDSATRAFSLTTFIPRYPLVVISGSGSGSYYEGATVNVTADTDPLYREFDSWGGADVGLLSNVAARSTSFLMPARSATMTATYRVSIARTAGCYGRAFTVSGAIGGVSADQTVGSPSGTAAAKLGGAGVVSDSGLAAFETAVSGGGTVTFWWKVSSEAGGDYLSFYADGALVTRISGTGGAWAQVSQRVNGAGASHTLRWEYAKNGSLNAGEDAGWVDDIVWNGDIPAPALTPDIHAAWVTNRIFNLLFFGERGIPYVVQTNSTFGLTGWMNTAVTPQDRGETNGMRRFDAAVPLPSNTRSGFIRVAVPGE